MKKVKIGSFMLLTIILISIVFSFFPSPINLSRSYQKVSFKAPFGFDRLGRNILIYASKATLVSLLIAFFTMLLTIFLGLLIASIVNKSSFFFFVSDSLKVLPAIVLALFLATIGGPKAWKIVLALSLTRCSNVARSLYQRKKVIEGEPFYKISLFSGVNRISLFFIHTFNHLKPLILEEALISISSAILTESSLSYLGCGVSLTTPSLGAMLADAKNVALVHPNLLILPMIILILLGISLRLILEGILELNSSL